LRARRGKAHQRQQGAAGNARPEHGAIGDFEVTGERHAGARRLDVVRPSLRSSSAPSASTPFAAVAKKRSAISAASSAASAPARHAPVALQACDLVVGRHAPAAFRQVAEAQRADGDAQQIRHLEPDGLTTAADLILAALDQAVVHLHFHINPKYADGSGLGLLGSRTRSTTIALIH
jgi:hypothetical protein